MKKCHSEVWDHLIEQQGRKLKQSTRALWAQEWTKHVGPEFGSWPIGRISTIEIKRWIAEMNAAGVGHVTQARCRSLLDRILEEAIDNGWLASNPASKGTRVKRHVVRWGDRSMRMGCSLFRPEQRSVPKRHQPRLPIRGLKG